MPVLEGRELVRKYGDLTALDGATFAVESGEVVAVAGPNGSGKTTLLSILSGVQKPDGGEIDMHGSRLGWVPQRAAVYGKLTVRENLKLFARLEGVDDPNAAADAMLERIALTDRADARAEELSGGMRQRLSIGVGLISDPTILLLDEPTAALDPLQRERLWELLSSLADHGITILFSTHAANEVEAHATRVLLLDAGALVYDGEPMRLGDVPGRHFEAAFVDFIRSRRGEAAPDDAASGEETP